MSEKTPRLGEPCIGKDSSERLYIKEKTRRSIGKDSWLRLTPFSPEITKKKTEITKKTLLNYKLTPKTYILGPGLS